MATTILMEPASLAGKMRIEPKAVVLDFKGRKSTNSFSPEECMMASYKLKEACLRECTHPIEMTQVGYRGMVNKLYYFGMVTFESEKYYLQVHQTIYFNHVLYNENFNLKESFVVKYRKKVKAEEPDFTKVLEITNNWCIMEDVDLYSELKKEFKFLTLIV